MMCTTLCEYLVIYICPRDSNTTTTNTSSAPASMFSTRSYLFPVWAAAYVFYFIPRHQYKGDIPNITLSGGDVDYDTLDDQDILEESML